MDSIALIEKPKTRVGLRLGTSRSDLLLGSDDGDFASSRYHAVRQVDGASELGEVRRSVLNDVVNLFRSPVRTFGSVGGAIAFRRLGQLDGNSAITEHGDNPFIGVSVSLGAM